MSFSFGPGVVKDGLVLYLDAANPQSYVSGSTNWNDLSTNKYIGTITGGPQYNFQNFPYISFDGINDEIVLNPESSGSRTGDFTFGGWFNPNSGTADADVFLSRGGDSFGNGWSLAISKNPTTNIPAASCVMIGAGPDNPGGGTEFSATDTTPLQENVWYNIIGTFKHGTEIKLYINGTLVATQPVTTLNLRTSTRGWTVSSISNIQFSNISVASVKIYNRVLSDLEIMQNYNTLKSRFGLT